MEFYDGTKLLSMKDSKGNKPEIFICTSNRSAGKTTYFSRYLVNRFIKHGEKFMLIYRFAYELADCDDKFFKDIKGLFFPKYNMKAESAAKGLFKDLYLNDKHCGYAIALNNADTLKKYSHLFSDTVRMLFDEFQSETNHYCPNEVKKFISIHTSVARGQGQQVRYLPVIMVSNPVSLINPYYTSMDIAVRLKPETNFLKGDGYVLEQGHNESASNAQLSTGFNKAFAGNEYIDYSANATYLNDINTFIEKPEGKNIYIATIRYGNTDYSVREYTSSGYFYIGKSPDLSHPNKICVTTDDMQVNYVMLERNSQFIQLMRRMFNLGAVRFKDLQCKEAFFKTISY